MAVSTHISLICSRSIVAGEVDTIEFLAGRNVHDVVEEIKTKAIAKAIASGADVATTKIVEVINLPVQYVTNEATRIIVKAAGDLAPLSIASLEDSVLASADSEENSEGEKAIEDTTAAAEDVTLVESAIDIDTYKPTILANHTWKVSEVDLGDSLPCGRYRRYANSENRVDRRGLWCARDWRWWFAVPAVPDGATDAARRQADHYRGSRQRFGEGHVLPLQFYGASHLCPSSSRLKTKPLFQGSPSVSVGLSRCLHIAAYSPPISPSVSRAATRSPRLRAS